MTCALGALVSQDGADRRNVLGRLVTAVEGDDIEPPSGSDDGVLMPITTAPAVRPARRTTCQFAASTPARPRRAASSETAKRVGELRLQLDPGQRRADAVLAPWPKVRYPAARRVIST